jgi:hypothetical protein
VSASKSVSLIVRVTTKDHPIREYQVKTASQLNVIQ